MIGITWTQVLIIVGTSLAITMAVLIALVVRDARGDR